MERAAAFTDIVAFLAGFRQCFTAPGYFYFVHFVQALWLDTARRTVTTVCRFAARAQPQSPKHFSNFHRFLKTYRWSAEAVSRCLVELVLTRLGVAPATNGPRWAPVALDDTLTRKTGRRMEHAGWQHDPMSPAPRGPGGRPPLAFGHCWVTVGLLWAQADQWRFLAWASWLFRPPQCTPADQQETKLALAARRFGALRLPAWLRCWVGCDGAYGKRSLVTALCAQGHHVLSRLAKNAVVYERPTPPAKNRRGRPRRYGEKRSLDHFARLAAAAPLQTLRLYGRDCAVRVTSFTVVSRALGGRKIQLVVVLRERTSGKAQALFLFSTDCQLAATQVVTWYAARFAIELGFRDLKQHFGLGDYQARRAVAAERHVTLCLVAYTWTQLLLLAGEHAPFGEAWRPAPALLTTGQLRYRLRQEQQARHFLAICARQGVPAKKLAAIHADLTAAA